MTNDPSQSSILTLFGPIATELFGSSNSRNGSSSTTNGRTVVDRAIGTAATLGLTLAILRLVATYHNNNNNSTNRSCSTSSRRRRRRIVRRRHHHHHHRRRDNNNNNDDDDDDDEEEEVEEEEEEGEEGEEGEEEWVHRAAKVCICFIQSIFLRKVMLKQQQQQQQQQQLQNSRMKKALEGGREEENEEHSENNNLTPRIHKGSCHCQSVDFQVLAPFILPVKHQPNGKIQFPHASICAKDFHLISGDQYLKMYYIDQSTPSQTLKATSTTTTTTTKQRRQQQQQQQQHQQQVESNATAATTTTHVGAHAFCSRCGVHVLFAPSSQSSALELNTNCLVRGTFRLTQATTRTKTMNDYSINACTNSNSNSSTEEESLLDLGVPLPGQWDHEQQQQQQKQQQQSWSQSTNHSNVNIETQSHCNSMSQSVVSLEPELRACSSTTSHSIHDDYLYHPHSLHSDPTSRLLTFRTHNHHPTKLSTVAAIVCPGTPLTASTTGTASAATDYYSGTAAAGATEVADAAGVADSVPPINGGSSSASTTTTTTTTTSGLAPPPPVRVRSFPLDEESTTIDDFESTNDFESTASLLTTTTTATTMPTMTYNHRQGVATTTSTTATGTLSVATPALVATENPIQKAISYTAPTISTSSVRDNLKFYMKKHLSS